jgi:hypothetical protein
MVTILPALRQVREDLVKLLNQQAVEELCRDLGYRWRDRRLDPWTTLHLFILQVLNQNTAMTHLPHLSGVSAAAKEGATFAGPGEPRCDEPMAV